MSNRMIGEYEPHVERINKGLEKAGISLDELAMLDHLCIRTSSLEEYEVKVHEFRVLGKNLGETIVMGRPITVIALDEPIATGGWVIPFLEIAAPKETSKYDSGLEHAEFVPVKLLSDFEADHPDLPFIKDAMGPEREPNPELKYRPGDISVKFHTMSLGRVIELEKLGFKRPEEGIL